MQVPEKLSLIGGSILLASTLVFTLKSQASHLLPKVTHPLGAISDKTSDVQNGNSFSDDFQNAQKQNWPTGKWGTSKWYIDKGHSMHIGPGNLNGRLYDAIHDKVYSIQNIDFDGNVQAPQNSQQLLSGVDDANRGYNFNIQAINHLNRLDTSNVGNMYYMFANDAALKSLDLQGWNTSNVNSMDGTFINNVSLSNLQVNNWNTSKVDNFGWMFLRDSSLQDVNLSGWQTNSIHNSGMPLVFAGATNIRELDLSNLDTTYTYDVDVLGGKYGLNESNNLQKLTLGPRTVFRNDAGTIDGTWRNGNQVLTGNQFEDNNPHPGTWLRQ